MEQKEIEKEFNEWINLMHPEKLKFNPTLIEITKENVIFGMSKHMGRMTIPIETIILDLKKLNNENQL